MSTTPTTAAERPARDAPEAPAPLQQPTKHLLRVTEAAAELGIHKDELYRGIRAGTITAHQHGQRSWRIPRAEVERLRGARYGATAGGAVDVLRLVDDLNELARQASALHSAALSAAARLEAQAQAQGGRR